MGLPFSRRTPCGCKNAGSADKQKSPPSPRGERAFAINFPMSDQKATVADTTTRELAIDEPSLVEEKFGVR